MAQEISQAEVAELKINLTKQSTYHSGYNNVWSLITELLDTLMPLLIDSNYKYSLPKWYEWGKIKKIISAILSFIKQLSILLS